MDKLDKIRAWAKDLDEPILCFVNGSDAEVIKLAKALLEEKIAEIILLGDELEVYDQCKVYRLPESRLYGVINPQNPPDLEQKVYDNMQESGENDRKKDSRCVKNPVNLAQTLWLRGEVDWVIPQTEPFPDPPERD